MTLDDIRDDWMLTAAIAAQAWSDCLPADRPRAADIVRTLWRSASPIYRSKLALMIWRNRGLTWQSPLHVRDAARLAALLERERNRIIGGRRGSLLGAEPAPLGDNLRAPAAVGFSGGAV